VVEECGMDTLLMRIESAEGAPNLMRGTGKSCSDAPMCEPSGEAMGAKFLVARGRSSSEESRNSMSVIGAGKAASKTCRTLAFGSAKEARRRRWSGADAAAMGKPRGPGEACRRTTP